ncbi:unnamed protein product [Polarella glacialis]|uniref:C3H1-type domain-containing protein n=1 Tax=Polarella glacialis TaxID=89957 RepID=A0A813D604_POLGL|nr:unnamed protein product [Polarella glacialis]CAE8694316.1 unnamed protein product [Polarella glacialis]|mmetsp:Transcript_70920/g.114348  ORF Transcript_70920/g.114348 Transcript_70920/m.114348 type:complete len:256 (-) Transcript_70920:391-1158(-)
MNSGYWTGSYAFHQPPPSLPVAAPFSGGFHASGGLLSSFDAANGKVVPRKTPNKIAVHTQQRAWELASASAVEPSAPSAGYLYRPGEALHRSACLESDLRWDWDQYPQLTAKPQHASSSGMLFSPPPGLLLAQSLQEEGATSEPEDVQVLSSACSTVDTESPTSWNPAAKSAAEVAALEALGGQLLGTAELPTLGSLKHSLGTCRPCAFVFKTGCASGVECQFCHLCEAGEKKMRKKDQKQRRQHKREFQREFQL